MTIPSRNNHRPRVARGQDKASNQTRQERSVVVQNNGPNSPLWTGDVKTSGEALIQAGVDLANGVGLAQSLRGQAVSAEKGMLTQQITWDERFNIYTGNAELVAVKPEDITNLGLLLLDETSYTLAAPLSVTASYDLVASLFRIHVRKPPGPFDCRIEVSPDPITATSFVALKGHGARRALSGYASGGWWVRALMFDNEHESAYSAPVFVKIP